MLIFRPDRTFNQLRNPVTDKGAHLVNRPRFQPAGGERRGKNRRITFRNISHVGSRAPRMRFAGYSEEFGVREILIEGLTHNGVPVRTLDEVECSIEPFAEGILLK